MPDVTLYWHDYETFGSNPALDRPAQFAGIRTDTDLNIIGDPTVLYCQPSPDTLPTPVACLITGITPQLAAEKGVPEVEFIRTINGVFSVPGTCASGYNSIRFDDEVTRYTLYRNLMDPYEREWRNGNSRWDLIDVARLAGAFRPEGINWPTREDGSPSFRLEDLCEANGISHESAHDALSDVTATIGLARKIREKQPRLFDFAFSHRTKKQVNAFISSQSVPFIHVSSRYPARLGCCALVAVLGAHPTNSNALIVWDLRYSPEPFEALGADALAERLFAPADATELTRLPIKLLHTNRAPVVCPATLLKILPAERRKQFELDGEKLQQNLQQLQSAINLKQGIIQAYGLLPQKADEDPDTALYSGGFFTPADRRKLNHLVEQSPEILAEGTAPGFADERLPEMLFRFRARNYPDSLSGEEQQRWQQFCYDKLNHPGGSWMTFQGFFEAIETLGKRPGLSKRDQMILEDLVYYGQSLM